MARVNVKDQCKAISQFGGTMESDEVLSTEGQEA